MQSTTHNTKDWATKYPGLSGKVDSSCSISGSRRVTHVKQINPDKIYQDKRKVKWQENRIWKCEYVVQAILVFDTLRALNTCGRDSAQAFLSFIYICITGGTREQGWHRNNQLNPATFVPVPFFNVIFVVILYVLGVEFRIIFFWGDIDGIIDQDCLNVLFIIMSCCTQYGAHMH